MRRMEPIGHIELSLLACSIRFFRFVSSAECDPYGLCPIGPIGPIGPIIDLHIMPISRNSVP